MEIVWIVLAAYVAMTGFTIARVLRLVPQGQRWKAFSQMWPSFLFGGFFARGPGLDESVDALDAAEPPVPSRTLALKDWTLSDGLVKDRRLVASAGAAEFAEDLDLDGTVVVSRRRRNSADSASAYTLTLVRTDGQRTEIFDTGEDTFDTLQGVSIQNGTVSWWSVAGNNESARLWIWSRDTGARVLAHEPTPANDPAMVPYGWTLVMGDSVAWTLLRERNGRVGVTTDQGVTNYLGQTYFPTMHRDLEAERHGRQVAACAINPGTNMADFQVTEIEITAEGPRVSFGRRGLFLGASLADSEPVGFRRHDSTLELPGNTAVPVGANAMISDVVASREWAAFAVLDPRARKVYVKVSWLLHLGSATRCQLTDSSHAIPLIRGDHVLWWSGPHERVGSAEVMTGCDGWLGRLNPPPRAQLLD